MGLRYPYSQPAQMIMHKTILLLALLALGGCASTGGDRSNAPSCNGTAMIETQLFFGMSRPGGGTVSDSDWNEFLQSEIVPRFAEGFSVIDSSGFWLDGQSKQTITEDSKIISRLLRPGDAEAITQIIDAYRKKFEQESVLRVDTPVCAKF
ncbi:MAG: DUF3574 domain-containing protein [Xanthomonadales bacterium]|nr:DUF3574 domain-containing protein [Xanthomonadales bacterium]